MKECDLSSSNFCPGQNAWRIIEDWERIGLVSGNPPDWARGYHYRDAIRWMPKWAFFEAAKPYRATQGFPYRKQEGDPATDLLEVEFLGPGAICFEFPPRTPIVISRACVEEVARAMKAGEAL